LAQQNVDDVVVEDDIDGEDGPSKVPVMENSISGLEAIQNS
jgi:hypothetical protein